MKTFLIVAAALAAAASASAVSAQDATRGGSEWKARPASGPRSGPPAPVRVRAKHGATAMTDCECPMMTANPADCMRGMPGRHAPRSTG
jgi:hypothetical protein